MKKILLIEDDADLFALLKYNLEREGYQFAGAQTGKGALDLCRREKPDLLLLDIMLPDSDGLEICRAVRSHEEFSHLPIMFLTAKAAETDRIVGLELGAVDYLVKPFFIRELIARIKVHLRDRAGSPKVLKAGPIELNGTTCQVRLKDQQVPLTVTEFKLLEFLMGHPDAVFSRDQLLDAVWGHGRAVTTRTVDVYILRLRHKLEEDPANPAFLHSARGFGYSFSPGIHQSVTEL
jgi:DNA-binding response OmpR family regulator